MDPHALPVTDDADEVFHPERRPDPGSPGARTLAFLVTVLIFSIVAGLQALASKGASTAPPTEAGERRLTPAAGSAIELSSKVQVAVSEWWGREVAAQLGDPGNEAKTPEEQIRAAIVRGEVFGPESALARLEQIEEQLRAEAEEGSIEQELLGDVEALRRVYAEGSRAIRGEEREGLLARHGWFGELAIRWDAGEGDADRLAIVREGRRVVVVFLSVLTGVGGLALVGLTLLITLSVRASAGQMPRRFEAPAPGGSVYLEMFALFLGAFLVVSILGDFLVSRLPLGKEGQLAVKACLQWGLLGVAAWPLVRGSTWSQTRQDLGLTRGAGVLKEIGCGVVGYLATLPALLLSFVVVVVLVMLLSDAEGGPRPHNPVVEQVSSGGMLSVVVFASLAMVWAPICEELVFRGALYRHVRSRLAWPLCAGLTAVLFAFMHGYGPLFTPPLIVLGFAFAWMREWRGSLVASITMHAIHNSILMMLIVAMRGA
ncbi:MAG: CPBP family intramembrane metalloprotease [Phycisphaeraceae bacterium]|nr:CPBP family intramembrane metalloprotease [Phycisphaeraceae bacterium]MCW5755410.1 CPBP family intramembrane metalloprotease [Phycisphaeraceae bacterium]